MDTPNADKNWLTLRNMVPRWGIWTSGLVNLLVLAISAIALWWVFFSNSGIFKLYTPLLGFSLVIWMLLIIMWQTEFFNYLKSLIIDVKMGLSFIFNYLQYNEELSTNICFLIFSRYFLRHFHHHNTNAILTYQYLNSLLFQ